jgi:hypothetical protein
MSNFKVGDKFEIIADSVCHSFKMGEIRTITHIVGEHIYSTQLGNSTGCYVTPCDIKLINNNNTNMLEKFKLAFMSEPEKSLTQAGFIGSDGMITSDGQKIFLTWLLREAEDFLPIAKALIPEKK